MEIKSCPKSEQFEEMFKEHFTRVYNYIYYRIGNAATAEDLTADVFVRAYEYWESYTPVKGDFSDWIGGIARNTVNTHFRKSSAQKQSIGMSDFLRADTDVEAEFLHKETMRRMFSQIEKLPDARQELLAMKYLLRLTNRDIAKLTGMSESNVGTTLHRIIVALQKNL